MTRRLVLATLVAGALAVWPTLAAGLPVQDPVVIGPHESFVGTVNGASANGVIDMACFGPIRPGQLGHPMSGQSIEVQLSSLADAGHTGLAHQIEAILTYPTPTASAPLVLGTFSSYYVPQSIATTALMPCGGAGRVTFVPIGGGPHARSWVESVTFAGQP